jgi:hypothetical protein
MDEETQIKSNQKIIIGFLVAVLVVFGLWWVAEKYFGLSVDLNDQSRPVLSNSAKQPEPAVDLAKLAEDYQTKSAKIFNGYFSGLGATNENLVSLSLVAQDQLLNLNLPVEFKEKHLAEVLLLGEIAEAAQSGQTDSALGKLEELKKLVNN